MVDLLQLKDLLHLKDKISFILTQDYPVSPTGTVAMQRQFAIDIRKVFKNNINKVYNYLQNNITMSESAGIIIKNSLPQSSFVVINNLLEKMKFELSPVVLNYLHMTWYKANADTSKLLKLGNWIKYDDRILKSVEDNAYKYLNNFLKTQQDDMKSLLTKSMQEGDRITTVIKKIKDNFQISSHKSELIARSEMIRTYGESTKQAIINGGVTTQYQWKTSQKENVCSICKPLHNKIFSVYDKNAPMPCTNTHPQCLINPFDKIFTTKGWMYISRIKIGDLVLTKEGKFRKVNNVFINDAKNVKIVKIYFNNQNITLTSEHPIYTERGYIKAEDITSHDKILVKSIKGIPDFPSNMGGWNKGLTKKTNERVLKNALNISKTIQNNPKELKRRSILMKNKNPGLTLQARKKNSEYHKIHNPMFNKESIKKMSKSQKERLKNPKIIKQMSESRIKFCKENPNFIKNTIKKSREKNPEKWEKKFKQQGESLKKFFLDHPEKHPNSILANNGGISKPQIKLFEIIKKIYKTAKLNFYIKTNKSSRWGDIVLPDKKIIIEYDGIYWHKNTAIADKKRDEELKEVGYSIIHVNENDWKTALKQIKTLMMNHDDKFEFIFIKPIKIEKHTKRKATLYNLEVNKYNNYIAKGIVVHNCNCGIIPWVKI